MEGAPLTATLLRFAASLFSFAATVSYLRHTRKMRAERRASVIEPPCRYAPLSADTLVVETERFLDTDQEVPDGPCSFYYSGLYYTFQHGDRHGGGRCYDDDPEAMSLGIVPPTAQHPHAMYLQPPYGDPLLAEIVSHLAQHEPNRTRLTMLCRDGYLSIDRVHAMRRSE